MSASKLSQPEAPLEDAVAVFLEWERDSRLFGERIRGISPWRIVRGVTFRSFRRFPQGQIDRPAWRRTLEALAATAKLLWLLLSATRRDIIVKTSRSALRLKQGDRFRDVYFDGLLAKSRSHLRLEDVNSAVFERQARLALYRGDLNSSVFTFWGRVLGRLLPVSEARHFCERTSISIRQGLGIELPASLLLLRISSVMWQARLYRAVLRRTRPKAVLVSDTAEFGLRLACSETRVPFIEFQHGVFDASHPDAVPADAEGSVDELLLPHVLAAWGDYWIEQLAGSRQRSIAVPVGNEMIDFARAWRADHAAGEATRILFTSQGQVMEAATGWLEEMIQAAPPDLEWGLIIKLHPFHDAKAGAYDRLLSFPQVEAVGAGNERSVFELLAETDLHLSISSASLFDAAALGVSSAIMPLGWYRIVLPAVDGDLIRIADTPAAVWQILSEPRTAPVDRDRYCTSGFVANMQNLVDQLAATRDPVAGATSEAA